MSEQQAEKSNRRTRTEPDSEQTFPLRLVRRETGETHWNVAEGRWEKVTHAETGEPNAEYALLATIDGVDVKLAAYNAGRIETVVRSQQQAQQQQTTES